MELSPVGPGCNHDAGRRSADRRIDEVRAWFGAQGRDRFEWSVGASATPGDLVKRLLGRGTEPRPREPVTTPMVLDQEPPPAPAGIRVRRVETFEDYRPAWEIDVEGSAAPKKAHEELRSRLAEDWAHFRVDAHQIAYLAMLEGEAVAYGLLALPTVGPPYFAGAATLPAARGRGAFRALVLSMAM
jgi:hypothetical protein